MLTNPVSGREIAEQEQVVGGLFDEVRRFRCLRIGRRLHRLDAAVLCPPRKRQHAGRREWSACGIGDGGDRLLTDKFEVGDDDDRVVAGGAGEAVVVALMRDGDAYRLVAEGLA
jgi:hypothetical protein